MGNFSFDWTKDSNLPLLAASVPALTHRFCTAAFACQRREYNRTTVAFKKPGFCLSNSICKRGWKNPVSQHILAGFGSGHWRGLGASADLSIFPECSG